ncbi:hypothetical protein ACFQV2_31575 [Actinokineospora soli]|uniref:Uncharacterized protein n=1 Tax=Actinokineospora soli TaxID=1048753 RepID=A0ABW2TWZ8_9PSEU
MPVLTAHHGPTHHLPDPEPATLLVVSRPVAVAHPHRHDLVVPFDEIRDADGHITACRALAHLT